MIFHKVEEVLNRNFLGLHLMVWAMLQMWNSLLHICILALKKQLFTDNYFVDNKVKKAFYGKS